MERIPDANRTSIRNGIPDLAAIGLDSGVTGATTTHSADSAHTPIPVRPAIPHDRAKAMRAEELQAREAVQAAVAAAARTRSATAVGTEVPTVRSRDLFVAPPLPNACSTIAERIPYTHVGDDRIFFAAEQMSRVPAADRAELREYVDALVGHMLKIGASDIDLGGPASNGWVWYRVHGDKRPEKRFGTLSMDEANILILSALSEATRRTLMDERSLDFSHELRSATEEGRSTRFRASAYFDLEQLALNMRAIPDTIRPLSSLDFHPVVEQGLLFRHVRDGLTIVTGVTGSGKSTTLDSIVDANNRDVEGHIVIIGRPIEFMHASNRCLVRHREVGRDVPSFKEGIVQALRQDPDIVVIGEMRDPQTISSALEITDSGHKVFSTLHTSSAVESLDRIVAEYPTAEQNRVRYRLADVLRCIVSQKLVPQAGGGRVLAKEVLWMTPSAKAAVKNGNTSEIYQMMWEGWSQGQITMEQDLFRLLKQGKVTTETAMNFANNKRRLNQLLK